MEGGTGYQWPCPAYGAHVLRIQGFRLPGHDMEHGGSSRWLRLHDRQARFLEPHHHYLPANTLVSIYVSISFPSISYYYLWISSQFLWPASYYLPTRSIDVYSSISIRDPPRFHYLDRSEDPSVLLHQLAKLLFFLTLPRDGASCPAPHGFGAANA